ncbi:hypothetical protein BaRGS_00039210, partial [Batillaria attramentaria]
WAAPCLSHACLVLRACSRHCFSLAFIQQSYLSIHHPDDVRMVRHQETISSTMTCHGPRYTEPRHSDRQQNTTDREEPLTQTQSSMTTN